MTGTKDDRFFGTMTYSSNKYFTFDRIVDDDTCIVITDNVRFVKGNPVLVVNNNQCVYLKDWLYVKVHNYYEGIDSYAVKLTRKFFKTYTFRSDFDDVSFDTADTFDSLYEVAKQQQERNMALAIGHMG